MTNMLWQGAREDGSRRAAVIDWQLATVGHGLLDLAHWFAVDLPVETRRKHERRWVELYRGELGARGVPSRHLEPETFFELYV